MYTVVNPDQAASFGLGSSGKTTARCQARCWIACRCRKPTSPGPRRCPPDRRRERLATQGSRHCCRSWRNIDTGLRTCWLRGTARSEALQVARTRTGVIRSGGGVEEMQALAEPEGVAIILIGADSEPSIRAQCCDRILLGSSASRRLVSKQEGSVAHHLDRHRTCHLAGVAGSAHFYVGESHGAPEESVIQKLNAFCNRRGWVDVLQCRED